MIYTFLYDGEFKCLKNIKGKLKTIKGEDALQLLFYKDKNIYPNVIIKNDKIILKDNNNKIILRDYNKLMKLGYLDYFYNNLENIKNKLNKNKKGNLKKGAYVGIISVGVLSSIMLGLTSNKIGKKNVDTSNAIEDELDNDLNTIVNNTNIDVENLINELDNNEENLKITITKSEETSDNDYNVIPLAYDESFKDEKKAINVNENYHDIINERASRWGISPDLIEAMINQESGGYSDNLMQIGFNSWKDMKITSYNYEKNKYETIILTNNKENYKNEENTQFISEEEFLNPKTNISVGCIILQYSFKQMKNNILASIQCYNYGVSNMNYLLEETSKQTGITKEEILNNQSNLSWIDNRSIIQDLYKDKYNNYGDAEYLEHIISYVNNPNNIWIKYIDENGEIKKENVKFNNTYNLEQENIKSM